MIRFGILTVSTTCSQHPERDRAGLTLESEIKKAFPEGQITFKQIVTDDKQVIIHILESVADLSTCDIVFTVGGTGFARTDVTPEATKAVIEKEAPGLAYALISKSLAVTEMAMLSRGVCGIKNKTIIINFPGSSKATVECFGFIKSTLSHAVALVKDEDIKVKKAHEQIQQISISAPPEESKVRIKAGASRIRKSPYPMIEVADAQKIILNIISNIQETQEIPIQFAVTRVLGEDIRSPNPVPAFPASIKDGYAVRASDGVGNRIVRSATAAGDAPDNRELQPGEIIRISTGAAVPAGADAVVQVEDTELVEVFENGEDEKIVHISIAPKIGQDIRQIGSDIEVNTLVLKKHTAISPAYIGVLAMLGIPKVKVVKRPTIGVISTGNELVHPEHNLKPGLIYDSNKVTLLTLLKSYGYDARDYGIAKDTLKEIKTELEEISGTSLNVVVQPQEVTNTVSDFCLKPNSLKTILENVFEKNDFIISSGGVSMSEYDLLKQVLLEDFGATIQFGRLNMKPGKPTVFATLNFRGMRKIVFALPGNPVSCCVTSLLFVIPTLKYLENNNAIEWPTVRVTLDVDINNADSRPEYVRLRVHRDSDNQLVASSTGNQISSRLNSMVDANALLLMPGKAKLEKGQSATVYLFGSMF